MLFNRLGMTIFVNEINLNFQIMKKVVLAFAFAMATFTGFAQEEAAKDSVTEGWKRAGNVLITFNQY